MSKELDFRTEGDNISRAHEGFRLSGLDVDVPQLVSASPSVLVSSNSSSSQGTTGAQGTGS